MVLAVLAESPGCPPAVHTFRVRLLRLLTADELAAAVRTAAALEIRATDPAAPADVVLDIAILPQPRPSRKDRQ